MVIEQKNLQSTEKSVKGVTQTYRTTLPPPPLCAATSEWFSCTEPVFTIQYPTLRSGNMKLYIFNQDPTFNHAEIIILLSFP